MLYFSGCGILEFGLIMNALVLKAPFKNCIQNEILTVKSMISCMNCRISVRIYITKQILVAQETLQISNQIRVIPYNLYIQGNQVLTRSFEPKMLNSINLNMKHFILLFNTNKELFSKGF